MKYVLYEGGNGDMLFAKESDVSKNPNVLAPFTKKTPSWTTEAEDDNAAVTLLNAHILEKSTQKK
jgi:hypothetical protein